jgi:hypothetical protein
MASATVRHRDGSCESAALELVRAIDARRKCEAEGDQTVTGWTRHRAKHLGLARVSAAGCPIDRGRARAFL